MHKKQYKIGFWYWYDELRFRIESVLEDRIMIFCPDSTETYMMIGSWMEVGCQEECECKGELTDCLICGSFGAIDL